MPPQSGRRLLCSVCRQIDFLNICPPSWFSMHSSLDQLRKACRDCVLCESVYERLVEHSDRGDKKWYDEEFQHLYEVRLSLDAAYNTPTGELEVSVHERLQELDDGRSMPDRKYNGARAKDTFGGIMSVHTDEDDPAATVVPWIRQVGRHTASHETL